MTKIPGITLSSQSGGTGLLDYVEAPYAKLVALLGPPNAGGDGYKVSTEWAVTFQGRPYTIYDYKDTILYDDGEPSVEEFRALPTYDWHIGGVSHFEEFAAVLWAALKEVP